MSHEQAGQTKPEAAESSQSKTEQSTGGHTNMEKWSRLVAQVWTDRKLKERLIDNPSVVLREHGIEPPSGSGSPCGREHG